MNSKEEKSEGSNGLNSHPTAKAIFAAFDANSPMHVSKRVQSDFVRKQLQSLGWRSRYSQSKDYPISVKGRTFTVEQIQRGEIDGTHGTGATVWPASIVLLKYLELHSDKVKGKNVIDLGSGTGITSMAAAILGAKRVVCTDGVENVVKLAQQNISKAYTQLGEEEQRSKRDCIEVQRYWWGSGSMNEQFDTIIIADCVLPKLYPIAPLVDALDELMKEDAVAVLSYEHRHFESYHPKDKFRELAEARGMIVKKIPAVQLDPVYSVEDIEIWEVTKK